MSALVIFGIVTTVCTAILTTSAVAKLLVSPITSAIGELKESIAGLGKRLEESDAEHHKDIKEIWRYLAEKE